MDRAERRKRRQKKIKQRSNLLQALNRMLDKDNYYYGKLANNNEMNALMTQGTRQKTNTRKSHSNYRRKGGFGSADNYSHRDAKHMEDMDEQIKSLEENEE